MRRDEHDAYRHLAQAPSPAYARTWLAEQSNAMQRMPRRQRRTARAIALHLLIAAAAIAAALFLIFHA